MGLNWKLERGYRSKKGNVTFVYKVSGTPESLASFQEAQGEFYREDKDDGSPLWFTTRCVGDDGELIITSTGKVVPDMSEFDKTASMVEQFGGNFGATLAEQAVAKLLNTKPATSPQKTESKESVEEDEDLDVL